MTAPSLAMLALLDAAPSSWALARETFSRGGAVMWPLLGCSLLSLTIIIERLLVFARCHARSHADVPRLDAMLETIGAGDFEAAIAQATAPDAGPVCQVLAEGLRHRAHGLSESMQVAADRLLDRLRRGLSVLDTIVTVAPLLGILGTVTGIIRSFHLLSSSGAMDPSAVTGGIAEALLTTAAGLIVAILALVPFNIFTAQLRRVARDLEQNIHRCEVACSQGRNDASRNGL